MAIKNTAKADINFPNTIEESLTGEVKSIWYVFCFLSSLISLIVRIGIIKHVIIKRILYT